MPYKLFNGNTNVLSTLLTEKRLKKGLSYSALSNKLQLMGVSLFKNDLFLIEKNRRLIRDFELIAFCQVLDIKFDELEKLIKFD